MQGLFDIAPAALTSPRPEPGKAIVRPRQSVGRRAWNMANGAARYEQQHLLGYIRLPQLQQEAAKQCRACPMAQRYGGQIAGPRTFFYCGPMGDENLDDPDPAQRHCGCVVLVGTEGTETDPIETAAPAARTTCSAFACPQRKWDQDIDVFGKPRKVTRTRGHGAPSTSAPGTANPHSRRSGPRTA